MNFDIGGVKPFQLLTRGIAGVVAGIVDDDLIGEQTYVIPPENVVAWSDQENFARSIRPTGDVLDFDVQFNWPPRPENEPVFTNGDGTYKVYLRVAGIKMVEPIVPAIKT